MGQRGRGKEREEEEEEIYMRSPSISNVSEPLPQVALVVHLACFQNYRSHRHNWFHNAELKSSLWQNTINKDVN